MPKRREQFFLCFCESCRDTGPLGHDGEPLGVRFPISQRISHLARVKAEREACRDPPSTHHEHSPPLTELTTNIFAHALTDDGPSLNSQPSRLWTSRNEFQSNNRVPSRGISETTVGVIAESIGRLAVETSVDGGTSATEQLSISMEPDVVSLPYIGLSATKLPLSERRQIKQEHNPYTKRAHRTLDHVERRAESCLENLAHVTSNAQLTAIESEVVLLRQTFDGVTRRVPSVDMRRATLSQLLSQIDTRVQELRADYPIIIDGPLVYDTSTFSYR